MEMQEIQTLLESILGICRTACGGVACSLVGMLLGDLSHDVRGGEAATLARPLVSEERGATASLRGSEEIEVLVLEASSEGHDVG